MNPSRGRQPSQLTAALTRIEVVAIIAVLCILGGSFWAYRVQRARAARVSGRQLAQRIGCVNNLKQVGLAFRLWGGDNDDKYPMDLTLTNGPAAEWIAADNVTPFFQVMSNELYSPKILVCPADLVHYPAPNYTTQFSATNISYFIGLDATETTPQAFLTGDANLQLDDQPLPSGRAEIPTLASLSWAFTRHRNFGVVCLGDGSVQQFTSSGLRQALKQTGVATNQLLLP